MSKDKKVTWTAKTRRGMRAIMEAGYAAAHAASNSKAEKEEVENAKKWLEQETEGEEP